MKARDWINNNSAVVTVGAVVVLVLALGFIIYQNSGSMTPRVVDMYYYDMNTGEIFLGQSDQVPPIDAPSGLADGQPAGLRAYVFSCGECPSSDQIVGSTASSLEQQNTFVGWVEKYTEEARQAMEQAEQGEQSPEEEQAAYEAYERGEVVKRPGDPESAWVHIDSDEGLRIQESISQKCPGDELPNPCYPER